MKINWFSPLPPTRSAIAQQSASVVPELAQRAEIVTWSSSAEWDRGLEQHAQVRHYNAADPPWREILEAEVTFYHIGNDPRYHEAIWRISRQHPGIVVLHDMKLQHLFAGLHLESGTMSRADYLALVERHHATRGRILAESYLDGTLPLDELADSCPLILGAVDGALAAVVHSTAAYQALADETPLPVAYLPLGASGATPADVPERCARKPGDVFRLIVFGFLGPNRRLPALLQALASHAQRHRFHLDIFGTIEGENAVRSWIRRLDLSDLVTLHGFVTDTELARALRESDVAVNLRYPTMGEASSSQLHLWQNALPSLVTRTGWYATLPSDTVAFVRPDNEIEDIQAHLTGLLERPEEYRALGLNGRRYVEEHCTLCGYAEGLLNLAVRVPEFRAVWSARNYAARAGEAMSSWIGVGPAELAMEPAQQIHSLVSEKAHAA
jgi:glycosyltransferase involved in cell wall biosynthesis